MKNIYKNLVIFSIILFLISVSNLFSIPPIIHYQAKLINKDGSLLTENHTFQFEIYENQYGGNALWTEIYSIEVEDGYINVLLGSMNPINLSFKRYRSAWLEITIDNNDYYPRTKLTSVPYSYYSSYADTAGVAYSAQRTSFAYEVPDSSITIKKLAPEVISLITGSFSINNNNSHNNNDISEINENYSIKDFLLLKPLDMPPSNPVEGMVYLSKNHHIYCYLNGRWKQLDN